MQYPYDSQSGLRGSLTKWLVGFFGSVLAFLLLPKTIKFFIRRFVLGVIGEVVAVVIAGLLTEKAIDKVSNSD